MVIFQNSRYSAVVFDPAVTSSIETEAMWPEIENMRPKTQSPATLADVQSIITEPAATTTTTTRPEVSAGMGFVGVVLGGIAGFALGGIWGAGAGVLGVGAARNGARAYNEWQSSGVTPEATKSATVALLGLAGAAWLGYNATKREGS